MPRLSRILAIALGVVAAAATPASADPGDGRHWELITGSVAPGREAKGMYADTSSDGNTVVYEAKLPQPSTAQGGSRTAYVARRSSSGWASKDASLPGFNAGPDARQLSLPVLLPPGADRILVLANGQPDPAAPVTNPNASHLWVMTPGSTVGQALIRPPFYDTERLQIPGGQQTLSSVYVRPNSVPLVADDGTTIDSSAFARVDEDGSISVATRLPDDTTTDALSTVRTVSEVSLSAAPDVPEAGFEERAPRAGVNRGSISVDGKRFYFYAYYEGGRQTQPTDSQGGPLQPLFVRDGDERTVAVSRSEVDGEAKPARFLGASPDGDVSYFVANETLDAGHEGGGVYRYQLSSPNPLTRLTPSIQGGASIDDLAITSGEIARDGSTAYFVTAAALGGGAQAGGRNAYVWRNGQLRFIADLGAGGGLRRVARAGDFAVFSTAANLVGADTGGFSQLYRYSYAAAPGARLQCASCRVDGSANAASSEFGLLTPSLTSVTTSPRGVSDDGRVFFTTTDRLTEDDTGAEGDAYEYVSAGPRMLTGGTGKSSVLDNSDDGRTVYVASSEALTPDDSDGTFVDVFARRTGSDIERATPAAPCEGEACRGAPQSPPGAPSPASPASAPGGNVAPRRRVAAAIFGRPSLSRSAARLLMRGERADVRMRVRGEGRLSIRGTARIAARRRVVASGSAVGRKQSTRSVTVSLRLNALGRRELQRRGTLVVRIEARFGSKRSRTTNVTVRAAR